MGNEAMAFADTDVVDVQDVKYTGGKNGESSALAAGSLVCIDTVAADGIVFKLPTAANVGMPLGILGEAVAAGAYTSKIIRRGVCNVFVLGHEDAVVGSPLKGVADQRYMTMSTATYTPGAAFPNATALVEYVETEEALKSCYVNFG